MMRHFLQGSLVLAIALLLSTLGSDRITVAQSLPQTQQTNRKAEADRLFKQGMQQAQADQYEAAITAWESALRIYREIGAQSSIAGVLMNRGIVYRALSRYEAAIADFNQALPIFQQLNTRKGIAITLNNRGLAFLSLSRDEDAIADFNQALPIFQQLNDRNRIADTLNNRGLAYDALSRYDDAIAAYNQALPIFQQLNDRIGTANALNNRGLASYSLSRYQDAITAYNQALLIFQQVNDRNGLANTLMNQGLAYTALSRYQDAITAYNQALPIFQQANNRNGLANALMNRGVSYTALSRYQDAIVDFDQALPIFQQISDRRGIANTQMNRGLAYHSLSRYQDAITAFNQASSIFQEINDRNGLANALNNRGITYAAISRYQDAIANYNQALPIFQQINDRNGLANTLMNRGSAYYSLSRYEDAIAAYNQALPIFQQVNNRNGLANALMNRGSAYYSLSRYEDAIAAYNQALPIFQQVKDRSGEATALNNLGFAFLKTRQFPKAESVLRKAIALYETIRLDRLSEDNKIALFETQARSYRTLQQILIAQNQPESALTISEWGRNKALVERLSQQLQPTTQLTTQAPNLNFLKQIAKDQNATLVEYSILYGEKGNEELLYTWVIQPNGTVTFRQTDLTTILPKRCPSIAQLIGNSRDSIGVRSPESDWLVVDAKTQKNPCAQSDSDSNFKTLHKLLIAPIADLLPTDPNQHVVFIPDRTLFLVPFPALKAANGQYLIEKHTIRTASSIQLLGKTRTLKTRVKGTNSLIVGNPLMPNDPTASQPKQLSNLPNAEQEAMAIAPLFNTNALTRKNGTKQTILQQMPKAKLIHFATHGSFYDRNGFKSWLAFAPTTTDSGILTAEEVAQMQLSADLVVLSACDTGRGRVTGDGVVGLSRAFIAAGVPSVIVSLWSVPDAPTADLMKDFYQQLQRNPDKAQALRQAMLSTLKTHPQPKNWAAFTLIGEAN
jgi:CHAT domain-containing protein/tetratricopeptide (TPR) repeat protein